MTALPSIMKLRACGRLLALGGVARAGVLALGARRARRRSGQGRRQGLQRQRLCAAGVPARRAGRRQGQRLRRDHGDHLQEADGYRRRPPQCRRAGLHQRGAARSRRHRDPLALARKVKVNTIPAGEWLYVDLLPDTWKGVVPGLPQEVIDELARRARDAERQLHQQRPTTRQQTPPTIRVKVATQPTFMRYVFEMPDPGQRGAGARRRHTDADFRPADQMGSGRGQRVAAADAGVDRIRRSISIPRKISFTLNGTPEVRNFREDRSIVVDIGLTGAKPKPRRSKTTRSRCAEKMAVKPPAAEPQAATATPKIEAPQTVPASKGRPATPKTTRTGRRRQPRRRAAADASSTAAAPAAASACAVPLPLRARRAAIDAPPDAALRRRCAMPRRRRLPRAAGQSRRPSRRQLPPRPLAEKAPAPAAAAQPKPPPPNPNAPVVVDRASQRRHAAPGISLRRADAGGRVPPRRHAVAGLRQRRQDRSRRAGEKRSEPDLIRSSTLDRGADGEAIVRLRLDAAADCEPCRRRAVLGADDRRRRHRADASAGRCARGHRQEPRQHPDPLRASRRKCTPSPIPTSATG